MHACSLRFLICAVLLLPFYRPRTAFAHGGHDDSKYVLDVQKDNMKKMAESLGVKCNHCHIETRTNGEPDFEAPSKFKHTAIHMKLNFVDKLRKKDGSAIQCAACHQGHARFLPRDPAQAQPSELQSSGRDRREIIQLMKSFQEALGVEKCDFCHVRTEDGLLDPVQPTKHKVMAKYMLDHYTSELVLRNGEPVTCGTCHKGRAEFLPRSEESHHEGE